jgi:hypothetical protein
MRRITESSRDDELATAYIMLSDQDSVGVWAATLRRSIRRACPMEGPPVPRRRWRRLGAGCEIDGLQRQRCPSRANAASGRLPPA